MPPTILSPATPAVSPGSAPAPPGVGLPGPRLVSVPLAWPPYDCETHGGTCPAAPEVAGTDPSAAASPPPIAAPPPARQDTAPSATIATTPAAAGATSAWPRHFAQVVVEILAGSRPPRQLIPWTTVRVRAQIGYLTRLLAAGQRPRIQRVVTSLPSTSVMEMTVVVSIGPRSRALAMRFERVPERRAAPGRPARQARWLCTEIESG